MADDEADAQSLGGDEDGELMTELDGGAVHAEQQGQRGGLSPSHDDSDTEDATNSNLHYGSEDHANVEIEDGLAGFAPIEDADEIARADAIRSARLAEGEQADFLGDDGTPGALDLAGSGDSRGSARGRAAWDCQKFCV